ncbi:hypothetical protein ABN763_02840 [Spongiivirga sp. MCCC 1A20706]|uniref:hypothetical protein n=1 Tax=Spongiivirga sp. MCCC 1A20706 TaxID=3160963 RepID=UPI00397798DC
MKYFFTFLLLSSFSIHLCYAQTFFDKVLNQKWVGSGELFGSKASFQMQWQMILDGKFWELSFQNQREQSEEFKFKAKGVYQIKDDEQLKGIWFDSRGITFPLKGNFSEDSLTIFWGTPETEEGKTIYTVNHNGLISVIDFVLKDKELVPFATASYRKAEN